MADNQVAATLAAALIQIGGKSIGSVSGKTSPQAAVEIYFQCVDALAAETKKRSKSSSGPLKA